MIDLRQWVRISIVVLGASSSSSVFAHGGVYPTIPPPGSVGGPSTPKSAATPAPKSPSTPAPTAGAPTTGQTTINTIDATDWRFWWRFNQDDFIGLRSRLEQNAVATSSDEFFVGDKRSGVHPPSRPSDALLRSSAVPVLERALASERSNDIQTACLVALAKIGDEPNPSGASPLAAVIQPFIKSPVQEVSETALLSLGILGSESPRVIDFLLRVAADDRDALRETHHFELTAPLSERQRAFAVYGLGVLGRQTPDAFRRRWIVGALARELARTSLENQRDLAVACIQSLSLVPLESAPALESEGALHPAPVKCLEQELHELFGVLDAPHSHFLVRAHVPLALARLASRLPDESLWKKKIARRLLADFENGVKVENEVLQGDVIALGVLADSDQDPLDVEIRALLRRSAGEGDVMVRRFALMASAECGARASGSRSDALAAAGETRAHLIEWITRGKGGLGSWAALALGVFERGMIEAHQASSADSRKALADALLRARASDEIGPIALGAGLFHDLDLREALLLKLDEVRDPTARGEVAVALGLLGDPKCERAIRDVLERAKYQPPLMQAAAEALGLLGDTYAVPHLIDMLAGADSLASQASIAAALGYIGDARSVAPLAEMVGNTSRSDRARAFAAVALGMIGDKQSLVWRAPLARDLNYFAATPALVTPTTASGVLDIL